MATKPSCKELEQRVKELEREALERKQAEEALRQRVALLQHIADHLPVMFSYIDSDRRYIFANRQFEDSLALETVVGKTIEEVLDPQTYEAVNPRVDAVLAGDAVDYERTGLTGKGDKRYFLASYRPDKDESGNVKGFFTLLWDITESKHKEEALRESEKRFRDLVEGSIQGIIIHKNIKPLFVNQAAANIHGYTVDEILKMDTIVPLFAPHEQSWLIGYNEARLRGEDVPIHYEYQGVRKDDSLVWVDNKVRLINWQGEPAVQMTIFDVTRRKHAEEALRESEERYRTILDSVEEGYFEVDLAGKFIFFNDWLLKVSGISRDELLGMDNREYMTPDSAKNIYHIFKGIYETGKPAQKIELELNTKDGRHRVHELSASLMRNPEGQPIGFRGIARDVTARKRMEMELTQTKNFLQNILDSSIDGITTTDLQGNVIYTSPRAKDILGYRKEKIIGKKVYAFYGNGREDAKTIMRELTAKGELREHEMKFIRKDGELIDINLSASLLKNEKGEVIGTLGICRDSTEKNILEAQLAQAQRMEALGTLAGGIAHNFNNLLMGIQGNASLMLLNKTSSDPDYERLKNIEKSVQNGSRLTRQLLGYAREGRYEIKPISLNQLVEETSNTFATTKKEITIHQELAKDLWGITADQGQIEQVLLNLYVNAADAMPEGGDLILKTMNVSDKDMRGKPYEAKPGDYVLVTIRDTGTGMDKKTMERIFDPFFTTKGLARGTGLGLASVYGTVKAHGGYIDVGSKRGQGTTFEIYLPASERKIEKPVKSAGQIIEGAGTILLVDDEEMVLDVGAQLLKTMGYTVLEAKGGREAVEIYRENKDRIDMVLLDMIMPDMGGGDAYDTMKEINPDIKVLLSSGYSIDGQATEIVARGCNGFIQKPFSMRELSGRIREILDTG